MTESNLRVAVLGAGYWGPNLVRNLHELPAHVEPFIEDWLNHRKQGYSEFQRLVAPPPAANPRQHSDKIPQNAR